MRVRNSRKKTAVLSFISLATVSASWAVGANTSGTWSALSAGSGSGTWSDAATGNWSGGTVADGSGFTADFSQLNITAASTVALGSARTIGNIIFGDTDTSTASSWILSNGGNAANVLTLAGTTPTITVNALSTANTITTTNSALISSVVSGTDGLTKSGLGTLVLTGANNYSGGTSVAAGNLRIGNVTGLSTGGVTVASGAALQLQSSINVANNITIGGSNGIYIFNGDDILSGTVSLTATSSIGMSNAVNDSLNLSGTLALGANALTINQIGSGQVVTISASITGTSASGIFKNGGGNLTLTRDNSATYAGSTTLSVGALSVSNDNALGSGALVLGATTDQTTTFRSSDATARTINNAVNLVSNTGNSNTIVAFGSTSGGTGNLKFNGAIGLGTLSGGGTARKFIINNRTEFAGNITGGAGISITSGTGTMVLSGTNTYAGATSVATGTMLINGSNTLGGAFTVSAGATLGGTGSIGSAVTMSGTIAPGSTSTPATLTTGLVTFSGTPTMAIDVNADTNAADKLVVNNGSTAVALGSTTALQLAIASSFTGDYNGGFLILDDTGSGALTGSFAGLTRDGNNLASFSSNGLSYTLNYAYDFEGNATTGGNDVFVTFSAVPEPSSLALVGLGGLSLLRRRRQSIAK